MYSLFAQHGVACDRRIFIYIRDCDLSPINQEVFVDVVEVLAAGRRF